jgi:NAD+-dependent protein deacetylase sirtuin 2
LTHHFIKILNEKKLLKRCFTQNIDGLERIVGIDENLIIEAHGTFSNSHCVSCKSEHSEDHFKSNIFSNQIPYCSICSTGLIKPNIVFFGESLPDKFFENVKEFEDCDLLIVMGTSLSVQPFGSLVDAVSPNCPRLLINRDLVGPFVDSFDDEENYRDVFSLGDCDSASEYILQQLNWEYPICPVNIPQPSMSSFTKRKKRKLYSK